jgi:cellulose synthase/poly-beta-1,6-N-acetylglucosamine synthase-like glycosyltransferase
MQQQVIYQLPQPQTGFEPPISLVVAAYNEEGVISASVQSLLQLDYPTFEIVIVNDGSKDGTLDVLRREFELEEFPMAFRRVLEHKPVRKIYRSRIYPNLRVIDKENGGCKSDAINAGINAARYGHFCPLDADTILERNCLRLLMHPFMLHPDMVAVGGNVRIANGCEVTDGFLTKVALPRNWLALCQILEYLRAFLTSRVGWTELDSLPLISGAFGLFHKESVIGVGGYEKKCLGEDMDLVLRLHREFRLNKRPYRISFVADATCWTEVPESREVLKKQRVRWQRGLFDALWANRKLLFHPRSGGVGWLAFPFLLFLEGLSPVIEVGGMLFMIVCWFCNLLSLESALAMLLLSFGTGFVLTIACLLVEEMCFHTYPKPQHILVLFAVAFFENFSYRQLQSLWRLEGTYRWLVGSEFQWGEMTRQGSWVKTTQVPESLPSAPPDVALSPRTEAKP